MSESNQINSLNLEEGKKRKNFFQIDLMKGVMISFVILDHALSSYGPGFELWERMAIPVFLIILGFNMGKSFKRGGKSSLKELYSLSYFKKKFWRYIFPYIIFYMVSTTIGFIIYAIYGVNFLDTFHENWFVEYILFQKSLLEGPGNWFIPVLFQSILLMPLLYYLFTKKPVLSLIMCFAVEICMHLFLFFYIGPVTSIDVFLQELPFRQIIFLYLSAIGMGIWFSQDHKLFSKRNIFVWILFPINLIYMIAWDFFGFRLQINGSGIVRGDYNYLTFAYSALIFLIVLRLLPKNPKSFIAKAISPLGKATYHIYLIQDLYYIILYIKFTDVWPPGSGGLVNPFGIASVDFLTNLGFYFVNLIICFSVGILWWYIEKKGLGLLLKR